MFSTYRAASADELWLLLAAELVGSQARKQPGRGLPTRELLHVAFSIDNPAERWILSRRPALNPAFALAEVVWILNGRSDAAFLNFWNPRLPQFAGDCSTYHGAYGRRLRVHFGVDQLLRAVTVLRANPDTRQVVLQIFDPSHDLPRDDGQPADPDIPCNISSILKIREGKLEWLQIMRSNDLVLGLPHNLVQFTTLQEVLAGWIGVPVGQYHQVSDSLHIYEDRVADVEASVIGGRTIAPQNSGSVRTGMDVGVRALASLEAAALTLIEPSLDQGELRTLVEDAFLPGDYANWLVVLGAEAARRHGWTSLIDPLLEGCTNPVLLAAWRAWEARVGSKRSPDGSQVVRA